MARAKSPESIVKDLERQIRNLQQELKSERDLAESRRRAVEIEKEAQKNTFEQVGELRSKLQVEYKKNEELTNNIAILKRTIHILTRP